VDLPCFVQRATEDVPGLRRLTERSGDSALHTRFWRVGATLSRPSDKHLKAETALKQAICHFYMSQSHLLHDLRGHEYPYRHSPTYATPEI
jgi:hypothetical protein